MSKPRNLYRLTGSTHDSRQFSNLNEAKKAATAARRSINGQGVVNVQKWQATSATDGYWETI